MGRRPGLSRIPGVERRAALLSLGVSAVLLAVKFVAYFLTGSSAIFADALESVVNVLAALLSLYALAVAHLPADSDHPYGHGKIEFLSAGAEGSMIVLAGVVILVHGGHALLHPDLVRSRLDLGLVLLALALGVNALVGIYLLETGRRRTSAALAADGQHLLADAVVSGAVVAAVFVVRLTHQAWVDPAAALAVGLFVVWTGERVVRKSAAGLMDEQDEEDRRLLEGILEGHLGPTGKQPRICSYHKLRHRHSGRYHWVDFHLLLPARFELEMAHRIGSAIEHEIEQALGQGDATAHLEPCVSPHCANCSDPQIEVPPTQPALALGS